MRRIFVVLVFILASIFVFGKTVHIISAYVKPEKDRAYYEGNVKVEIPDDKVKLECETMVVTKLQNEWRIVEATKAKVFFEDGEAIAEKLRYDLKLKTGTLTETVQAKVQDKQSEDVIELVCDTMNIDLENDVFSGESFQKVLIIKGKIEARAKSFSYDRKNGIIKLEKDVEIVDRDKNIKMWAESVQITTADDKMIATNARVELVLEE
ncbi:LptA/OstA family protein [Pseudothermotoga thermarum]|uniref:Organic solvent tolerance-like N-terminal domain-containing protein n=1 Tax=Pseudothermotoga thermarum DSM 5069 TaxID=688269 RepID=F7YVT8_9THEM|nr:LptA/OstA family protein [Pseudothermotoga thermarum]AEH51760.1 hypothetical protein Theth_1715 [Pseudothermotoga thermarum DSM 5069]